MNKKVLSLAAAAVLTIGSSVSVSADCLYGTSSRNNSGNDLYGTSTRNNSGDN